MKKVSGVDGFKYTTSIKKLRKLTKRTKVIPGGSSAGKTFSILPILIDKAIKTANLEISVVSESIPHLRKGAIKDFLKIMRVTGRYVDAQWNRTLLTYYFANGSYIEFFSADQDDKVRGPRRNILYINECNNLKFETYHQLAIRTSLEIWLDFNPSHEFWVYSELNDDEDVEWLTLTYKDNEGLPESIVKELEKAKYKAYHDPEGDINDESNIKSKYWANWWLVYGLGLLGSLEGVILSNWSQIKDIPQDAKYIGTGLDFGYTNDPSSIVDVYSWQGKRIVDLVLYKKKQDNDMLATELKNFKGKREVWADSAEPKSIDYIYKKGVNIKPVVKGADSIVYGLEIMQKQDYLITERSLELIKEVRFYIWGVDKEGNKLNKPATGQQDHAMDAWRYCEMMTLGIKKGGRPGGTLGKAMRGR